MTDDDDIVEAIRAVEYPVARAKDVAERVDVGKRAVLNRLEGLVEEGRVERLDVGARSAVWWVADTETETIAFENGSTIEVGDPAERELEGVDPSAYVETATADAVDVDFDAIDLPGSGAKLDERRDALRACVAYLAENGVATRADFEADVYPEHPARYETPRSWWKNCLTDGLSNVAERSDAVEKPDYTGDWRYLG